MDAYEALADPTRRAIVAMLATGARSAGDIADRFPIAGPSVSRHLKVLRESGLISYRRDATSRIYRLESEPLDEVRQWMQAQLDLVRDRFDRLGAHLEGIGHGTTGRATDHDRATTWAVHRPLHDRVRADLSAPD